VGSTRAGTGVPSEVSGPGTADLLAAAASLRWVRPDLTAGLADHVLASAAVAGDRDRWLAAAGWGVYARSATGDGRDAASDVLEALPWWGSAPLAAPAAHRLRVELALVAVGAGETDIARTLLEPVAVEGVAAELRADACCALARCAIEDAPQQVADVLHRAEAAWAEVGGAVGDIGTASVALITAAAERRAGRPDVAVDRAAAGLAHLERGRGTAPAGTPSGYLAAALATEWIAALLDAGRADEAREGCIPLTPRLTEPTRPSRQLARLRLTVARAAATGDVPHGTADALEQAAKDAAGSDVPDLEAVCRSTLGAVHEKAGRPDAALEALRLGVAAERNHRSRGVRVRTALAAFAATVPDVAPKRGDGRPAAVTTGAVERTQKLTSADGHPAAGRRAETPERTPSEDDAPRLAGHRTGDEPARQPDGDDAQTPWTIPWGGLAGDSPIGDLLVSSGRRDGGSGRCDDPRPASDAPPNGEARGAGRPTKGPVHTRHRAGAEGPRTGDEREPGRRNGGPARSGDGAADGRPAGEDSGTGRRAGGPARSGDRAADGRPAGEDSGTGRRAGGPARSGDRAADGRRTSENRDTTRAGGPARTGDHSSATGRSAADNTGPGAEKVRPGGVGATPTGGRRHRLHDPWTTGNWSAQPVPGDVGEAAAPVRRRDRGAAPTEPLPPAVEAPAGPVAATADPDSWLRAALADLDRIWGRAAASDESTGAPPTPEPAPKPDAGAEGCVVAVDIARAGRRFAGPRAAGVLRAVADRLTDRLPRGARLRQDDTETLSIVLPGWGRAGATEWMHRTLSALLEGFVPEDDLPGTQLRAAVHDADGLVGAQILRRLDHAPSRRSEMAAAGNRHNGGRSSADRMWGDLSATATASAPGPDAGAGRRSGPRRAAEETGPRQAGTAASADVPVAVDAGGRHDAAGRTPFRMEGVEVLPGSGGKRHRRGPDGAAQPPGGQLPAAQGSDQQHSVQQRQDQQRQDQRVAEPVSTEGLGLADLLAGALAAYRGI
jgi:collagen type I/II/III/V/XI/XXIV/XXVII alpha